MTSWFVRPQLAGRPSCPREPKPIELRSLARTAARVRPAVFPVALDRQLPPEVAELAQGAIQFPVTYVGGVVERHNDGKLEVHVYERPSGRDLFTTLESSQYRAEGEVCPGDEVSLYTWDEIKDGEVTGRLEAFVHAPEQDEALVAELTQELEKTRREAAQKFVESTSADELTEVADVLAQLSTDDICSIAEASAEADPVKAQALVDHVLEREPDQAQALDLQQRLQAEVTA